MSWKCSLCMFWALTLRILLRHICTEHSQTPNFSVVCTACDGCPQKYTKYNSLYRHVIRHHAALIDQQRPLTTHSGDCYSRESEECDIETEEIENQITRSTESFVQNENSGNDSEMETEIQLPDLETSQNEDTNKRPGVEYLMNLKEFHKIREITATTIANGTNAIVQRYIDILQHRVYQTLHSAGINPNEVDGLSSDFDLELPFQDLQTAYERNKFIQENYFYVNPETVSIGQRLQENTRQGKRQMDIVQESFVYFPITKSIEQFLQNRKIFNLVMSSSPPLPDGFYSDISTGSIFQNHILFKNNKNALQIMLYFDDLEICNPISKKSGSHKVGLFYYTLGNIPPKYRSRLPAIRIVAIIKRSLMNKYNINVVLDRIKSDLDLLSQGITINVSGIEHIIKGACICFIGDTLAANEFGGFKLGVGFSYQKCRECECTFDDMQKHFYEKDFIHRSLFRYDQQCDELEQNGTQMMRDILSTSYGICYRSVARGFPHFDLTNMIPQDIMHVLFEGVGVYEIKAVLNVLTDKNMFTLTELNKFIQDFNYGYKNKSSKPVPIPPRIFNSEESNLHQSASSMIVLMKLLPFFLVEKLNCDISNPYLCFLIELCEIALIVLSPIISRETIELLTTLIACHLNKFKVLFPDKNIIPKHHFLLHVPSTIERFGSMTNVWSMRFEGKHQFVKQRMSGSKNFINVVKSVADRCALYECTLNVCEDHPLFNGDLSFGKLKRMKNEDVCRQSISSFFGFDTKTIKSINDTSWIIYNGQKFIQNQCEIAFGETDGLPEFGTLCSIWISNEEHNSCEVQNIYFQLKMFETVTFNEKINAYEIREPSLAQGMELVHIDNIFVKSPLHKYNGNNNKQFIPVPYDLVDVVRLKQQSIGFSYQ